MYSAADLFVNPSRAETFGLVTAEALSCGTPVVAYDNTGSSEIVSEDCGMLVEDGNVDELVSAVKTIIARGKEVFSQSCRRRACDNFEKNVQVQKYINLYKTIISK